MEMTEAEREQLEKCWGKGRRDKMREEKVEETDNDYCAFEL